MPQLYCQLSSRPDPWLLGRTSAGLCTLQTACPLTVTYSGGSPASDTIAAGSAATVYGGSAATFDASTDVWVVLTVPASGTLQVVKEADLATVAGDWAGLARVVQHSTEPYQPQAYLGAGGVGTVPPSSYALVSDGTALRKSLWTGSTNNDPDVTYAGWTTLSFTETAWAAAVVATLGVGQSVYIPSGASPLWDSTTPTVTASPGEAILLRQHFVLPTGTITSATLQCAFDAYGSAYLNGTLIGGETGSASGPLLTLVVPPGTLLGGAANVIALKVYDDGGGGTNKAWGTWRLDVQYVASGGVPDPGGSEGDLLYYHSGAWVTLPPATNGYELTLVSGDPAWTAQPSSGGTVTSVALTGPTGTTVGGSPVTSSGTLALSWASQTANTVLAAPNGSAGAPTFRVLAAGDIPSLPASQITAGQLATARGGTGVDGSAAANGVLLIGNGSGYTLATLTAGSGVSVSNSAGGISISATGSGGSVTSVALSLPGIFSVAGSPVTTSGTLAVSLATQSAHAVFAGPASGSSAAPTFRALQGSDLPAAAGAGGHIHAHGHFL